VSVKARKVPILSSGFDFSYCFAVLSCFSVSLYEFAQCMQQKAVSLPFFVSR